MNNMKKKWRVKATIEVEVITVKKEIAIGFIKACLQSKFSDIKDISLEAQEYQVNTLVENTAKQ